jgi:hypothetical protein
MDLLKDPHTLLIVVGAAFLLIGLLGGGLEISAIKVPTVGKYPRLLLVVLGVLFVVMGLLPAKWGETLRESTRTPSATTPVKTPTISLVQPLAASEQTTTATAPPAPLPVREEQESNDKTDDANLIELGTRVRGSTVTYQDRDFFKFRTSSRAPVKVRVILRKLSPDGFGAAVKVYDQVEQYVTERTEFGEQPVSLTFTGTPQSLYYILVKAYGVGSGLGTYELEVREE